jgi:hypothetical protein
MMKKRSKPTDDGLAGARRAGGKIYAWLMAQLATERGVQVEAVSAALGAFAGRACQLAAFDGVQRKLPDYVGLSIVVISTSDGGELYSGDAINRPLAESEYSFWALVAWAASEAGAAVTVPDDYFHQVATTVGSPEFGIPRGQLDAGGPLPATFLPRWDAVATILRKSAPDPQQWPVALGVAVQNLFAVTSGKVDTQFQLGVVMESAIAMSKVKAAG